MNRYITLLLFIGLTWGQVTVDGYAYLENQSEHDSIQVIFERIAPSSLLDTAYTVSDGYYSVQLETGIYNVNYSKDGYFPESLTNQQIYTNTTLSTTTLSEYTTLINVPDDFATIQLAIDVISNGDTILVQPGTYVENINFSGKNIVIGSLTLTTGDTGYISQTIISDVIFYSDSTSILYDFLSSEDSVAILNGFSTGHIKSINSSTILQNLSITGYGTNDSDNGCDPCGGGLYFHNSSAIIRESIIKESYARYGGGLYCDSSYLMLNDVIIKDNFIYNSGGGINSKNSSIMMDNVNIIDNISSSSEYGGGLVSRNSFITLDNSIIAGNYANDYGGGIWAASSDIQIANSIIQNNVIEGGIYWSIGSAMSIQGNCSVSLNNVDIIDNNFNDIGTSVIYCANSNISAVNVNVSDNGGHAFQCLSNDTSNLFIQNSLLLNNNGAIYNCNSNINNSSIINNNPSESYSGIISNNLSIFNSVIINNKMMCSNSENAIISYSLMTNTEGLDLYWGCNEWIGINVTTNVNGDSCDAFYNIQETPLFCEPQNGDFTLAENSPCIDAGDPNSPYDPDGTIADMGAFGIGCEAILSTDKDVIPLQYVLHQNYPNPFNPVTTLRYDLPEDAEVKILIFDIMGRKVKSLVNTNQNAGFKSVMWDATNDLGQAVSAGMYLYKITAGDFHQTKKMVLLK